MGFDPNNLVDRLALTWVREQEEKQISPKLTLGQGLKRIPAHWLNAVCRRLGLEVKGKRAEREKAVVECLLFEGRLRQVLRALPPKSKEALVLIMSENGVARLSQLKKRFGPSDEDGWFWEDRTPASVVGQLRLSGLVFIGRVPNGGRGLAAAVIPKDLRARLEPWLSSLLPSPEEAVREVFAEMECHYEEIDWEPDIRRDWVEGYLQEKMAGGADPEEVTAAWKDLYAFILYQERTEWSDLSKIPHWAYSVGLEWIEAHFFDFRLNLRSARRLLGRLLAFFGYLQARGLTSGTDQLERAIKEVCGGQRLQLIKRLPADEAGGPLGDGLDAALAHLKSILANFGSGVVAFSAGVDSTLLLRVAAEVLGRRVLAVTGISETYPEAEREEAVRLAREFGVDHLLISTKELGRPEFAANSPDRCYYCKNELFGRLSGIAGERGLEWVLDGSNLDDLADYRPGRRAAEELRVRSPLQEAGLGKAAVREISRRLGLPTWDKPALACLSSRFPYGEEITPEKLRQVDRAEAALRAIGLRECRIRYHGPVARIEVPPSLIAPLAGSDLRERLVAAVREAGFLYVALDLEGYRTGSLNRALEAK